MSKRTEYRKEYNSEQEGEGGECFAEIKAEVLRYLSYIDDQCYGAFDELNEDRAYTITSVVDKLAKKVKSIVSKYEVEDKKEDL